MKSFTSIVIHFLRCGKNFKDGPARSQVSHFFAFKNYWLLGTGDGNCPAHVRRSKEILKRIFERGDIRVQGGDDDDISPHEDSVHQADDFIDDEESTGGRTPLKAPMNKRG